MISELVRLHFSEYRISRWLLNHYLDIEILDLSTRRFCYNDDDINDEVVKRLTNLKELNLDSNTQISLAIENLSLLTKLNLTNNFLINDFAMRNLTKMKSLTLHNTGFRDKGEISDLSLKNMKCLEVLHLSDYDKVTNEGIKNLPNLNTIRLAGSRCQILNEVFVKNLTNVTDLTFLDMIK